MKKISLFALAVSFSVFIGGESANAKPHCKVSEDHETGKCHFAITDSRGPSYFYIFNYTKINKDKGCVADNINRMENPPKALRIMEGAGCFDL